MESAPRNAFSRARPVHAPRLAPRPLVLDTEVLAAPVTCPHRIGAWLNAAVAAETRIMTPAGPRAAGCLQPGDTVLTVDSGAMRIRWMGRRPLSALQIGELPSVGAIKVPRNALGGGCPRRDIRVSPRAGLLVHPAGAPESGLLMTAEDLVGSVGLGRAPAAPVTYVQILLDHHAMLAAEGLGIESFQPATLGSGLEDLRARAEILAIFPELEHGLDLYGGDIRPRGQRQT